LRQHEGVHRKKASGEEARRDSCFHWFLVANVYVYGFFTDVPFFARKPVETVTVYVVFVARDGNGVNSNWDPPNVSLPVTGGLIENDGETEVESIKKLQ
jgi:hypothetical protein